MVVADISEESANETLGSLSSDLRGQGHMAAVVDVSSKESVKKLVTSIQVCVCVCVCGTDRKHTVSITAIMCSVFREIHTFFSVEYTSEPCRAVICPLFSSLSVLFTVNLLSLCRLVTFSLPQCV